MKTAAVSLPATLQPVAKAEAQPWIRSLGFDGLWILGPPFLALLLVALLPATYQTTAQMPTLAWLVLVVFIDVSHVYSTLFRTYFDPVRRQRFRTVLWAVPLGCYLAGVALYGSSDGLFWRVLAYVAVFHFIRQQYGFLRLYSRQEKAPRFSRYLDVVLVYAATLYPLLYWHLSLPRHFVWFVEGDFLHYNWPAGRIGLTGLYILLLLLYLGKELYYWRLSRFINYPRNLLLLGTAASWYVGIVWFNGDLAFTLLNVVAHGIPYLALVWTTSQPEAIPSTAPRLSGSNWRWWHGRYGLLLFLGVLAWLAYLEEGLWDGLVWREHAPVFGWFQQLPSISDSGWLTLLVPLLALPQATHYVLDGFIWRRGS